MEVWVYRPLYGDLQQVLDQTNLDHEAFAQEFCAYFPQDIYFFAELVSL